MEGRGLNQALGLGGGGTNQWALPGTGAGGTNGECREAACAKSVGG